MTIRARSTKSSWQDGFQAGAFRGYTILRKRENFRKAFHNFDPEKISRYGKRDFERLMKNEGIIRSNAKIRASPSRAYASYGSTFRRKSRGGFRELIWKHEKWTVNRASIATKQ